MTHWAFLRHPPQSTASLLSDPTPTAVGHCCHQVPAHTQTSPSLASAAPASSASPQLTTLSPQHPHGAIPTPLLIQTRDYVTRYASGNTKTQLHQHIPYGAEVFQQNSENNVVKPVLLHSWRLFSEILEAWKAHLGGILKINSQILKWSSSHTYHSQGHSSELKVPQREPPSLICEDLGSMLCELQCLCQDKK